MRQPAAGDSDWAPAWYCGAASRRGPALRGSPRALRRYTATTADRALRPQDCRDERRRIAGWQAPGATDRLLQAGLQRRGRARRTSLYRDHPFRKRRTGLRPCRGNAGYAGPSFNAITAASETRRSAERIALEIGLYFEGVYGLPD